MTKGEVTMRKNDSTNNLSFIERRKNNEKSTSSYIYTGEQLMNMTETEIPHLWSPFIPSVGLTALTGGSDVGKSSFLRQFVTDVALRKETFLGFKLNIKHGSCIYLSTEDNVSATSIGLRRQVGDTAKAEDLKTLEFIISGEDALKRIRAELIKMPADAVVIDAYADVFTGQTNDVSSVRRFLNDFNDIANEFGCAVIFLHHNGKRTEGLIPSKNNIIGSQGFEAKMRTVMELRRTDHLHERELSFLKGNYLLDEWKSKSLLLNFDDNQVFSLIEVEGQSNEQSHERVYSIEQKEKIMAEFLKLRKQGLSIDKARIELEKLFDKVPSKGALSTWKRQLQEDDEIADEDVQSVA